MARLLLIATLVVMSGCGGGPTAPSAISPPVNPNAPSAPSPANHAVWTGSKTLTSVTGGECVGPIFAASIGSVGPYDLSWTQNGSSVTAVATDRKTGLTIGYTGTMEGTSMSLGESPGFSWSPGDFPYEDFACGDGQVRDVWLGHSTLTVTVSENTATGTVIESFDIMVAEMVGNTRHYIAHVGELVLTSHFVLTR